MLALLKNIITYQNVNHLYADKEAKKAWHYSKLTSQLAKISDFGVQEWNKKKYVKADKTLRYTKKVL